MLVSKFKVFLFVFVALLGLSSCQWMDQFTGKKASIKDSQIVNTKAPVKKETVVPKSNGTAPLLALQNDFLPMNRLNAKADVDVNFAGLNQDVNAQIRWIRDSIIWMNFSMFGIEGARLLITKDSFFLVDRINSNLMIRTHSQMSQKLGIPLNFQSYQHMILGEPFIITDTLMTVVKEPTKHTWQQSDSKWLSQFVTDPQLNRLVSLFHASSDKNTKVQAAMSNFRTWKNYPGLSCQRNIKINTKSAGNGTIDIDIKEFTVNTVKEIRFSLPSSYDRI